MSYDTRGLNDFINSQDEPEQACQEVATINGLPNERARFCIYGQYNCTGCPWGGVELLLQHIDQGVW